MEFVASKSAPLPTPINKVLFSRNAWLVNLLTSLALGISIAFVSGLRMQSEAEMYVLIGVAGSAYLVLQSWTLILCARAFKRENNFTSSYFALMLSLLLFNVFLLAIHNSQALSIHPIREELRMTALPVLLPVFSVAMLITLPLARWIAVRRIHPTETFKSRIHAVVLSMLLAILLPIPLFVYLSHVVEMQESPQASASVINGFWKFVLRATPEPIANSALTIGKGTRWHDAILRTGCPSAEYIVAEVHPARKPQAALSGLWRKDRELALKTAANFARTCGKPVNFAWTQSVAEILVEGTNDTALEIFVADPSVLSDFRDAVVVQRFPPFQVPTFSPSERDAAAKFIERTVKNPVIRVGPKVMWAYAYTNSVEGIRGTWTDWILEKNSQRAHDCAQLVSAVKAKHRAELILMCLKNGSDVMQDSVVSQIVKDRLQFSHEERGAILRSLLPRMERRGRAYGNEIDLVSELSNVRPIPDRKGLICNADYLDYFERIHTFLKDEHP